MINQCTNKKEPINLADMAIYITDQVNNIYSERTSTCCYKCSYTFLVIFGFRLLISIYNSKYRDYDVQTYLHVAVTLKYCTENDFVVCYVGN